MNRINAFILLGFWLVLLGSCSKTQDELVLDSNYLTVADVLQYCQGSCDETDSWEGQTILIAGHLQNANNDSVFQENKDISRFYLLDIRNGMFLQVQVEGDEEVIFERLSTVNKMDKIFIRATASPVFAQDGNQCTKGVVILLEKLENLQINLQL